MVNQTENMRASIEQRKRAARKRYRRRRSIRAISIFIILIAGVYCFLLYTKIPAIANLRELYIATAMNTMNHKWLATLIIPKSIIEDVIAKQNNALKKQQTLMSTWNAPFKSGPPLSQINTESDFFREFPEIDQTAFSEYIVKNPSVLNNGYHNLLINRTGFSDQPTNINTVNHDPILAIDAANRILIIKIYGINFAGRLAIVKDPSKVAVAISSKLGKTGESVQQIAEENKAVLAVNASGFADYQALGNGGKVMGLLIANSRRLSSPIGGDYVNIGFNSANRLYIGMSTSQISYRDAVEFMPALIINGQNVVDAETNNSFGLQPRTAIGQEADGTVLLLTVDGRQVGYSLGCTVGDCAGVLKKYGAVQAANLDGGSSTIMFYRGKNITKPADAVDYGRLVPDAIIVK